MTMAAITEHPELWAAAVDIVGIVNFVTFLERTGAYRRALREAEYGSLEHDRAFLERISPIHKVDRIVCPLLVVHGANDPRVPVSEAEQVVAALRERGGEVQLFFATRMRDTASTGSRTGSTATRRSRASSNGTSALADGPDLAGARTRVEGRVWRTPVLHVDALDEACGARDLAQARVPAAHRQLQVPGGDERRLATPRRYCRGGLHFAAGNHAQAVARAARDAGIRCLAVMPIDSNPSKIAATAAYGAEVERDGVTAENREQIGRARAAERGWPLIHPFDDWDVLSGQGTAALELIEDAPALDAIVTPVGAADCSRARPSPAPSGARRRRLGRRARLRRRCAPLAGRGRARQARACAADDRRRRAHPAGRRAAVLDPARGLCGHRTRRGGRAARGARDRLVADEARDRADLGAADRGGARGRDPRASGSA